MSNLFIRSKKLLGDSFDKIASSKIAIIGLGGVGGTAFEGLLRTGVNNFLLVDGDVIDESNLNRQILYTYKDIGQDKVQIAKARGLSINKDANIETNKIMVEEFNINFLDSYKPDVVIDAIDDIKGKIAIVNYCMKNNIKFIMSLGMANRLDPSQVIVTTLDKTSNDPLAKILRNEFRKLNIELKDIPVVFSKEEIKKDGTNLNSIITVPSSAGLNIVNYVRTILSK